MLSAPEPEVPSWTFLTNHAHVLIVISQNPDARQRDVAYAVGITVGAVQRIIHDLEEGGYLVSERVGRRNHYSVIDDRPLRHPVEEHHTVHDLLASVTT
jgi:predicted transcriptional regulator